MQLNSLQIWGGLLEHWYVYCLYISPCHHIIHHIVHISHDIPLCPSVTNLRVKFVPQLTFENCINHICNTSVFHHCNIAKLHPCLSLPCCREAGSRLCLDYCNAFFTEILTRVRKYEHINPIFCTLHWLLVDFRVENELFLHTHHGLHPHLPQWTPHFTYHLQNTVRSIAPSAPPKDKAKIVGWKGLWDCCSLRLLLWNTLLDHLRDPQIVDAFVKGLPFYLNLFSW